MLIFCIILFLVFMLAPTPTRKYTFTSPKGQVYCLFSDMLKQSHLLIAGCQGSGKSVVMNGIIDTILYCLPFDREGGAQCILLDPKCVEFSRYEFLPHVLAYAEGFNPDAWIAALRKAASIMDSRKIYMKKNGLRKYDKGDLYVIIDEWATIYKNGGKEAYKLMMRLVSEGRAERVHVIMATQVPKASIIPTEIRENFDARLCLRTTNAIQSRVIMESNGCEELPRYGQGYYVTPEDTALYNIPYVKEDEIESNLEWWKDQMRKNKMRVA